MAGESSASVRACPLLQLPLAGRHGIALGAGDAALLWVQGDAALLQVQGDASLHRCREMQHCTGADPPGHCQLPVPAQLVPVAALWLPPSFETFPGPANSVPKQSPGPWHSQQTPRGASRTDTVGDKGLIPAQVSGVGAQGALQALSGSRQPPLSAR